MAADPKKLAAFIEEMRTAGISMIIEGASIRTAQIEAIPTGLCSFDLATGIGGLPRGRIVEFSGPEAAGKSMLALLAVGAVQRAGGLAGFIDAEHALTPSFAKLLGVDMEKLVIMKPENLEEAFEATKRMAGSGLFDLVVFDSVAGIASKDELALNAGDSSSRAVLAQLASVELKKLVSAMTNSKVCVIFINQIREKPDSSPGKFDTTYTPGGRSFKHHASIRAELKIKQPHMRGKQRIGHRARVRIVKNKVAAPYTEAEFDLYYKRGIDKLTDLIETALASEVIVRESSFYIFENSKWHGEDKIREALKVDRKLAGRVYKAVMASLTAMTHTKKATNDETA